MNHSKNSCGMVIICWYRKSRCGRLSRFYKTFCKTNLVSIYFPSLMRCVKRKLSFCKACQPAHTAYRIYWTHLVADFDNEQQCALFSYKHIFKVVICSQAVHWINDNERKVLKNNMCVYNFDSNLVTTFQTHFKCLT